MIINMDSIMRKVKAFSESPEGKRRAKEVIVKYEKEGRKVTGAGCELMSKKVMYEAAEMLIEELRCAAHDAKLPDSVLEHFDNLGYSEPVKMPDGSAKVYVYFKDDLHRDSLQPEKYGGVNNIIAVLNNGYDEHESMAKVWGVWHGTRVHALTERTGLHFIQQAIMRFNSIYGAEYNATAISGGAYQ